MSLLGALLILAIVASLVATPFLPEAFPIALILLISLMVLMATGRLPTMRLW